MKRSAVLVAVLLPAAVWVNWPTLRSLWHDHPEAAADRMAWPDVDPITEPSPAPLAEIGAPFQPILPTETLPDPFVHPTDGAVAANHPAERQLLPQVSMILRAKSSVRAVIDGRAVTVGDQLELGTITAIEARSVNVRTRDGKVVRLALRAPVKDPATPTASTDDPEANKD